MKKIIILTTAILIGITGLCIAETTNTENTDNTLIDIGNIRPSNIWVTNRYNNFSLFILLRTTDEDITTTLKQVMSDKNHCHCLITLGKTEKQTIRSLKRLKRLSTKNNVNRTIKDKRNNSIQLKSITTTRGTALQITMENTIGEADITTEELDRAINLVNKYKKLKKDQ